MLSSQLSYLKVPAKEENLNTLFSIIFTVLGTIKGQVFASKETVLKKQLLEERKVCGDFLGEHINNKSS